ncbi:MAG: pilus assembly protein TadG-related protein [Flavobacteriaceae bacterium]
MRVLASALHGLLGLCRRFSRDHRGNISIIFGATIVPVIALTGAAIDFTAAHNVKIKLQAAADAAALAATRNYGKNWATRQQIATSTFNGNLQSVPNAGNVQFSVVDTGQAHHVDASATVETSMMGLMGIEHIQIAVDAEAVSPAASIEVVLVLDNTGSMSSNNKISILKQSAKNFIDMMEAAAAIPGKSIKIGLVPFTTMVRVDANTYRNASWINMSGLDKNSWRGCFYDRRQPYDIDDTPPSAGNANTLFDPDPYNGFSSSKCAMARVHELSTDFTGLRSRVDQMAASGNTNITLGVIWGLHLLSNGVPFTEGVSWSDAETVKIMIVLTDGENTQNRWTTYTNSIDARTQSACNAVKAKDVLVYTVRVVNGDASLLRNCATDTWMYTDIQNASDLNATFQQLAADIINRHLRLTM